MTPLWGGKETWYEPYVPEKSAARAQRSRSRKGVWMVGKTINRLPCSRLPTNRQCLQKLFYIVTSRRKQFKMWIQNSLPLQLPPKCYTSTTLCLWRLSALIKPPRRIRGCIRNGEISKRAGRETRRQRGKRDSDLKKNSTLYAICQRNPQREASEQIVSEATMTRKQTCRSCVTNERDVNERFCFSIH